MILLLLITTAFPSVCGAAAKASSDSHRLKRIILDTDLFSDVDDAGAILLLLTSAGVETLAVGLSHPSRYSALAAAGIIDHYSSSTRPHQDPIPLALPLQQSVTGTGKLTDESFLDRYYFRFGEYASKVAYRWAARSRGGVDAGLGWDDIAPDGTVRDGGERWGDAVDVYRRVLARVLREAEAVDEAEVSGGSDWKVTFVVIGFLDNVCGIRTTVLLISPRRKTSLQLRVGH